MNFICPSTSFLDYVHWHPSAKAMVFRDASRDPKDLIICQSEEQGLSQKNPLATSRYAGGSIMIWDHFLSGETGHSV